MDKYYIELIKSLVPLKYEEGHFRETLINALENYEALLRLYNEKLCSDIDSVIRYVEVCNMQIKKCIDSYSKGMYSVAYQCIDDILSDTLYDDEYFIVPPKFSFYRSRLFKTNGRISHTEMFHIPFNKRGKVETQRYSAPGYPCLYLGSSVNACWEELGQPRFDDMMVSRFVVKEAFPVLDLRMPKEEDLEGDKIDVVLKKIPLIISISIKTLDRTAFYKPEYIIPQLIIEYIITKNRIKYESGNNRLFDFVLGVYYTSVHINDYFNFPDETFDNLALPAVLVDRNETYCQLLASCFEWTDPTSYSYESISGKFGRSIERVTSDVDLTEKEANYRFSKMGELEERLSTFKLKGMLYCLTDANKIFIDSEGHDCTVYVRANVPWTIE